MTKPEQPTRTQPNPAFDRYTEDHPAYAMIGASRVSYSPPGVNLAGSDFKHQHFMVVRIHRASRDRGLSNDWWHAGKEIVEVALSEAQWATFVSTPNHGAGVPATLVWDASLSDPRVPGIIPIDNRRMEFNDEVREHLDGGMAALDELKSALRETKLSAKAQKELLDKVERARMALGANLDFVAHEFDKHAEKTIEHAKIEIEAWMTSAIQRAGLEALGGVTPPIAISSGEEDVIEG